MSSIEFNASIINGVIQLPLAYKKFQGRSVRVVLYIEPEEETSRKKELSRIFESLKEVNAFSEIENPVNWQKQQRDEWE